MRKANWQTIFNTNLSFQEIHDYLRSKGGVAHCRIELVQSNSAFGHRLNSPVSN